MIPPKLGFDVDSRNDYIHISVCQTKNAKLGDIFKARIINAGKSLVTQMTVGILLCRNKEDVPNFAFFRR